MLSRTSKEVLHVARLFTDGETAEQIQVRLAKARTLSGITPRSSGYRETRKTRRWWVRAFEQILAEQGGSTEKTLIQTVEEPIIQADTEDVRWCGRCGGSGSIGGSHLAGLAELAADQFGDAGKVDCPTCGGTGRSN